jgi:hypothetical protein
LSDTAAAPAATESAPAEVSASASSTSTPEQGQQTSTETPAQRKYRMALEGKEERDYTEDEIRANFLKGRNASQLVTKADQRLRAALEKEQAYSQKEQALKDRKSLRELIEQHGHNPRELAEEWLLPEIQREMMTEEQRRIAELESQLQKHESERQAQQKAAEEAELSRQVEEYQNHFGQVALQALQKTGLPATAAAFATKRLASLMEQNLQLRPDEQLSPDELAEMAADGYRSEFKSLADACKTDEELVQWLGEDVIKRLRRYDLARLKAQRTFSTTPPPQPGATTSSAPAMNGKRHYLTPAEAEAELARRLQAGD